MARIRRDVHGLNTKVATIARAEGGFHDAAGDDYPPIQDRKPLGDQERHAALRAPTRTEARGRVDHLGARKEARPQIPTRGRPVSFLHGNDVSCEQERHKLFAFVDTSRGVWIAEPPAIPRGQPGGLVEGGRHRLLKVGNGFAVDEIAPSGPKGRGVPMQKKKKRESRPNAARTK